MRERERETETERFLKIFEPGSLSFCKCCLEAELGTLSLDPAYTAELLIAHPGTIPFCIKKQSWGEWGRSESTFLCALQVIHAASSLLFCWKASFPFSPRLPFPEIGFFKGLVEDVAS